MENIDRKFKISAVCHAHGHEYTEADGVFFKAGDAAFNERVINTYKEEALKLGAHQRQLLGIELMKDRVMKFKAENPAKVKVPDVDEGPEESLVNRPNDG